MTAPFNWTKLEKLEASIAWRRELENEPLAHVWHLETVADLAAELRRLMLLAETDEQLISVLWRRVPGDERSDVLNDLRVPGTRFPDAADRLHEVLNDRSGLDATP
jgi:hypothetical protein